MLPTTLRKTLVLVTGAFVASGLITVAPASAATTSSGCAAPRASLEPARDYQVFPDDLDATMQSLKAAITRRDTRQALVSDTPLVYEVFPDNLDATMLSLQGAITRRDTQRVLVNC